MALRNPVYLDLESLLARAEYNEIDVPVQTDIVERTVQQRTGNAKLGYGPIVAGGSKGSEVELQSSYTMTPTQKATVSKVIDGLMRSKVVSFPGTAQTLVKDELIELDGVARVTSASLAGKMLYLLLQYMKGIDQDLSEIEFNEIEPEIMQQMQGVYLGNELVPIPMLIELTGTGLEQKVFVDLQPSFFIDSASVDRIEGEMRVLGTVRNLVGEGDEGYLSSEEWLLSGWEYLMKRMIMLDLGDQLTGLADALSIDLPENDVHAWISGPAIVIEAIAIY
ncbi:DUF6414 family protein [Arthrobacter sp. H14]|uniref:DUF6414 family protein n=1 Tax=Arthrobacter sp. H14 TaxID=1312959 RepID=UPI0012DF9560|nr:hypothetical protein [Arthrobacter sp. H14]